MNSETLNPQIVLPEETRVLNFPEAERISIVLGKEMTDGAFSLLRGEVPPGVGQPLHVHQFEDETFCVLEGEVEMQVGDQRYTVTAGTVAFLPRSIPHAYGNLTNQTARVMVFTTPSGLEDFLAESHALMTQGEPDKSAAQAVADKYGIEMVGPPLVTPVGQD